MISGALFLALAAQGDPDPDRVRVSARFEDTTLAKVLETFRAQSKVPIELDEAAKKRVDLDMGISLDIQDLVLTGALRLIFSPQGLEVEVVGKKKVRIVVPK